MNEVIQLSTIIAVLGCFIGLSGWFFGRDKKIISESKWRGSVDAKLDLIVAIKSDIVEIKNTLNKHSERIAVIENNLHELEDKY